MSNTCADCPALVAGQEAADFWGVSLSEVGDFIYCSRYGHVLGDQTTGVRVKVAERYGASCSSYGQGVPVTAPVAPKTGIYTPRTDLLVPTAVGQRPAFCGDCKNYDQLAGACAATGMLIFSSKEAETAKRCNFGTIGNPQEYVGARLQGWEGPSTTYVKLATAGSTSTNSKPPRQTRKAMLKVIEPCDYASDAPVTAEHTSKGIRAWRKVTSPRGKDRYIPIFRTDFFSEEDQALIPSSKNEDFDPSLFVDHDDLLVEFAVQVYTKDLNLVLIGEPGTGKTDGVGYIAWVVNMPFRRLSYTPDSQPDQYLGMPQYGPHEVPDPTNPGKMREVVGTYFAPGDLPKMWTAPGVGLSDEPNTPRDDSIIQTYRSMNDSSRELVVYGRHYKRNDYCFHIMAMNPHYDFRNIGAKPMASADSRRLSFHLMTPPDDDTIKVVLTKALDKLDHTTLDNDIMKVMLKTHRDLRQMALDGSLPDFWTISQDIKVARLIEDFGLVGAYQRAYFNYVSPEITKLAMDLIVANIPKGVDWR